MASHLNRPGDFQARKGQSTTLELLPPSSFIQQPPHSSIAPSRVPNHASSTSREDQWQALTVANQDIATLKLGNEKLRTESEDLRKRVDLLHAVAPAPSVVQPPLPLPMPVPARYDVSHYDDIINRQAADIASLRKQLQTQDTDHQKTAIAMETKHMRQEALFEQQMLALRGQLDEIKANHSKEMQLKQEELQHLQSESAAHVENCTKELSSLSDAKTRQESKFQATISELQDRLLDMEQEKISTIGTKDSLIQQHTQKINQLKSYISESEDYAKSTDIWRKDVETLKSKLQKHGKEKENLQSTIQLLNIRLSSQNKIMTIQENELATEKEDFTQKSKFNLLTRWREKVYEMLVQQKCAELSQRDEEHRWQQKLDESQGALQECQCQLKVLQHSIQDRDAQLEMERHTVKRMEEELTQAQELVLTLDQKNQEDRKTAQMLADFSHSVYMRYQEVEDFLVAISGTVKNYNQRIAFASGRVEMLQSQFARREAHLKLTCNGEAAEKPTHDYEESRKDNAELDSVLAAQSQVELDRVTQERDHLAQQLKEDALLLQERINSAKDKYANEVEDLRQRLSELHDELDNKKEKIAQLTTALDKHQAGSESAEAAIKSLQLELLTAQEDREKAVLAQKVSDDEHHAEKLSVLDRQLNDARREHAKAVVSYRQLERQMAREKEKMTEYAHTVEQHYTSQCGMLEERLRAVETDRNMLMTTIRQEGLLSKVKSQRLPPALLESEEESPQNDESPSQALTATQDLSIGADEPLHAVIDDLRSLTAAVLEDNVAEEDSSEEEKESDKDHSEMDEMDGGTDGET